MDTASVKDKKRITLEIPLLNCTILNTTFAVTIYIIDLFNYYNNDLPPVTQKRCKTEKVLQGH